MAMIIRKPYISQPLTVRHKTGMDLTGATFLIRGFKPGGDTIDRIATRVGSSDIVTATFLYTDLDEAGEWRFQTFVSFGGVSNTIPCNTQRQLIYELGS